MQTELKLPNSQSFIDLLELLEKLDLSKETSQHVVFVLVGASVLFSLYVAYISLITIRDYSYIGFYKLIKGLGQPISCGMEVRLEQIKFTRGWGFKCPYMMAVKFETVFPKVKESFPREHFRSTVRWLKVERGQLAPAGKLLRRAEVLFLSLTTLFSFAFCLIFAYLATVAITGNGLKNIYLFLPCVFYGYILNNGVQALLGYRRAKKLVELIKEEGETMEQSTAWSVVPEVPPVSPVTLPSQG
ncbi:MAG: hypothetical protein HRU48_02890 [Vibrio sp.]|uniref:hypothetical protein n=1 Tax=Vibrio TaxID=662 RepID=UPI001EBEDB27|nr:hypothetical protein [Vibrio sp.]NRB66305.1 hypothetical protein [Vibrio sp.]